jgi:hypothetical protein
MLFGHFYNIFVCANIIARRAAGGVADIVG